MESSETSTTPSIFRIVIKKCGHEMKVLALTINVISTDGPCDACWRVEREEKEHAEHLRVLQR